MSAAACAQRVDVGRAADRGRELAHREPLQREQVALGHHARDAAVARRRRPRGGCRAAPSPSRRRRRSRVAAQRDRGCAHHARRSARRAGAAASTTRPITSWRVKIPSGRSSASTTGSEPMRRCSMSRSASPIGVPARVARRLPQELARAASRGRALSVTLAAYSACSLRARQVEQVREAPRAEILEHRRRGDQLVEDVGREHQAEHVAHRRGSRW